MKKITRTLGVVFILMCLTNFELLAQVNITYTTTDNTVCEPVPVCNCNGKLTSVTLLYRGQKGVTIRAYRKNRFVNSNLITTVSNVQDGQILIVTSSGGSYLNSSTYLWIVGTSSNSAERIRTSCSQISLGETFGHYTVIGYSNLNGNSCALPLCNGTINIIASGGMPPYTYRWDNQATSSSINNLCSGTYRVTVSDSRGRNTYKAVVIKDASSLCDDNDLCTTDRCVNGHCAYTAINCNDRNSCTTDECINGICVSAPRCDDDDPCTYDVCWDRGWFNHDDDDHYGWGNSNNNAVCLNIPKSCRDLDPCTIDECVNGICVNRPQDCSDGNSCTLDVCRYGNCRNTFIYGCHDLCASINCDDQDLCTTDACNNGQCAHSQINCNDNDGCTIDDCANGQCQYNALACDDNDLCTSDLCANGHCISINADCNDGNECTIDGCVGGGCIHTTIAGCGNLCANSDLAATISGVNSNPCSACNGAAVVTATGGTPPYSYLWASGETTESIGSTQSGGTMICINAGGPQYLSLANDLYLADAHFGGTSFVYANNNITDIANTDDDLLYKTERNTTDSMFYSIPVTNGQYKVELHFAELYFGAEGGNLNPPFTERRVFDVFIEGGLVLDNYDINADVGPAAAVMKSFSTTVTDGILTIKFISVINRAKISAICVKPESSLSGLCSGSYAVTVTDAVGCNASNVIALCNNNDPCSNMDCDDANSCTLDGCTGGVCIHTLSCDDNDACTGDACVNGQCVYTSLLSVTSSIVNPLPCGACNGLATASPTGGTPPYSYSWSNGETGQSIGGAPATTHRCINSGGAEFVSSGNVTFEADWDFSGTTFTYSNNTIPDIANTIDDVLFRSERNTMDSMFYNIVVTNGTYDVELYFAELYFGVPGGNTNQPFTGKRVFDVFIEGTLVLDNYDINAEVGPATADIRTFTTTVSDQTISIKFVSVVNRAKISGICVKPSLSQPSELCAGVYNVTVTDASGCSAQATAMLCNGQKTSEDDLNNKLTQQPQEVVNLEVSPIPFAEVFRLDFNAIETGKAQVRIVDMLGKIVVSQTLEYSVGENNSTIKIDNRYADGMYFMEFRIGENVEYVKLYKSR